METPPLHIMDKVEVIAQAHFMDTNIGAVSRKQRLWLSVEQATRLAQRNLVRYVDPKPAVASVPTSTAPQGDGGGKPSASLQADPASQTETASLSPAPDGQPSPSTTPGEKPDSQKSSTPVTTTGGKSTAKQSKGNSKASAGPKTTAPKKTSA